MVPCILHYKLNSTAYVYGIFATRETLLITLLESAYLHKNFSLTGLPANVYLPGLFLHTQLPAMWPCSLPYQPSAELASPLDHFLNYQDKIRTSLPCIFCNLDVSLFLPWPHHACLFIHLFFLLSSWANWRKGIFVNSLTNDKISGKYWQEFGEYLLNSYWICWTSLFVIEVASCHIILFI